MLEVGKGEFFMSHNEMQFSKEDFIAAFQNIINSDCIAEALNFDIYAFDRKLDFVCCYDKDMKMVCLEQRKQIDWIKNLQEAIKKNAQKMTGIQCTDTAIYIFPVFINELPVFQLVIPATDDDILQYVSLQILADYIGYIIVNQRSLEDIFLKSEYQEKICEATSEGYLTINKAGELTYINRVASKILGIDPVNSLGKHISHFFDYYEQMLEVLHTGEGWANREFYFSRPSKRVHLIKNSIPLVDDKNQQIVGSIFIFREMNIVRDMVGDIVGNKAMFEFADLKYQSEEMKLLVELAKSAARTDSSILIESESGTGKEMLAQAIHNYSYRCSGPFITIDCSSIPRDLVESELFGYVEGAFTGANKNGRFGKFELAHGGTIFLDEIGEMPLEMQSKLLRVIQERTITRVGGNKPIPINIRIIAATNRNLEEEITNGNFRLDLYYRLNVMHLTIPPLRQRLEDIPILANEFIEKTATREGRVPPILANEAIDLLKNYSWPGNVRELENVMERATLLAEDIITPHHLPQDIAASFSAIETSKNAPENEAHIKWENVEYELIINTLQKTKNNKSAAAKMLGISRSALYDKLKKYQIKQIGRP